MPPIKTIFSNRNLFLFGLFLVVVGMPLSKFLMSLGQFVMLGNWIIEGEWKRKWQVIRTSRVLWVLSSFYLMHLVGLLWTSDFNYAANDLRIKLPLLWFPLLFSTTRPLEKKEIDGLLNFFIVATFLASIISMFVLFGWTRKRVTDIRDISIFNSHIRFALMIVLCICILLYDYLSSKTIPQYFLKGLLVLWFVVFLMIMESLSGILILGVVLFYIFIRYMSSRENIFLKYFPFILLISGVILMTYLIKSECDKYYTKRKVNYEALYASKTPNGKYYHHDTSSNVTENGYPVWLYNEYDELRGAWNKVSSVKFDSIDKKGNLISHTLIRYLTSKGFRKDSFTVTLLTTEEIAEIERGVSNYRYSNTGDLRSRIHEVIWEYDNFLNGINPSGHSLLMRLEFWKTGLDIVRAKPLFGVGTGDVRKAFELQYRLNNSKLEESWRLRSHNQFLAIAIAFGIAGLLLFCTWLFLPPLLQKNKHPLFALFFIIALLSMLNEDTLETQAGVTFYGFFYCCFLFSGSSLKERFPEAA
ncbi:MAG: O-antigen ligase family protein [Bacteroidia bacterium]